MVTTDELNSSSTRQTPSVLVVTDSGDVSHLLLFCLEQSGYRATEAGSCREGLEAYDREQPDLVIVDLEMSGLDGQRLLAELNNKRINQPAVVIVSENRLKDAVKAVREGAWDYLTTPINNEELKITMMRVTGRVLLTKENLRYRDCLEEVVLTKTRELRDGRMRYQRLLESVTNYAYTVSFEEGRPTGTVHQQGCEKVTGYTPAEYDASPDLWHRIVHGDDRQQVIDMDRIILTESKKLELEHRIIHKNGSIRWIKSTLVPSRDMEGTLLAYDGIVSDITERKQADLKLRESEERFSQLFLQHEDAIILFRLDSFGIIDANPAATELYGYGRDEIMSAYPWPFVGSNHAEFEESLRSELTRNNRFDVYRRSLFRKDGTPVVVSMRGKLVTISGDKVVYCSIRDITEKIRLEEDVRDTQSKLIQASKMASLGMLSSGIAHEINNPNNFIMFNSSLLAETWQGLEEVLEEHAAEHGDFCLAGRRFSEVKEETPLLIAGLTEGARRIQAIVETLKGFVRHDLKDSDNCIDINRIVRMAMTLLSHEIRTHPRGIKVDLGSNLPPVAGKSQQIEQVVINLVTNALHAVSGNGGGIRLATSFDRAENNVTITVKDEGAGMSKAELERVAEPFFTTKSAQGGSGLGVSISLSIVREHHGTLVYESEPGVGTTAVVRLPVSNCTIVDTGNSGVPL